MLESTLTKKDKKIITIICLIGVIAKFFIESAMDIAILCSSIYIFHKYVATTENIREYDSYEFKDKARYNKEKKIFVCLVDIYIAIRIIFIFLNPQTTFVFKEILSIVMIYIPYEMYLHKKYVIRTNFSTISSFINFNREERW